MKEKLWFKRKWFGWGWRPSSWHGWAVTVGYAVVLILLAINLGEDATDKEAFFKLLLPMIILSAALIRVAYTHGEKPRWQWGKPKDNK